MSTVLATDKREGGACRLMCSIFALSGVMKSKASPTEASGILSMDARVWKRRLDAFYGWLTRPVHASSLCLFRIVYAYVMMAQILKWGDMFDKFQTSIYTLHYPGVGWIKPVSPFMGDMMLTACFFSSVALGIGFMTRIASIMNYLLFAYLFHICHSNYNNHYVLMCHINFVGCFVNWGTWGSLDAFLKKRHRRPTENTVPYWHLWLMQLLFCVPYFWGSVAKMNNDWLFRAQPLIRWFSKKNGWFYHQWWFPWFIAWTGMGYDFTISFLLFWKKTRFILGFPGAFVFNFSNKMMFNIGVFPFAMMASLVLFLDPDHPAKWWKLVVEPPSLPSTEKSPGSDSDTTEKNEIKSKPPAMGQALRKRYVLTFVMGFLLFHSLYPLRHFALYKSNPSWTEEGHTGAWHMKLRSKHGWVYLEFTEENGNKTKLSPRLDPFIGSSQLRKVETRPDDLLTYAGRLRQVFNEANRPVKAINVYSCFSLNVNSPRELYISAANLVDHIGKYEWIGVTGVDKWIHAFDEAPPCDRQDPLKETKQIEEEVMTNYEELYDAAHLYTGHDLDLFSGQSRYVYYVRDVEKKEGFTPGYVWKM